MIYENEWPEGAVVLDGFDDCIIGKTFGPEGILIYSVDAMQELLVQRDGMDEIDAEEYLDFNVLCLYAGPRTPKFVWENRS